MTSSHPRYPGSWSSARWHRTWWRICSWSWTAPRGSCRASWWPSADAPSGCCLPSDGILLDLVIREDIILPSNEKVLVTYGTASAGGIFSLKVRKKVVNRIELWRMKWRPSASNKRGLEARPCPNRPIGAARHSAHQCRCVVSTQNSTRGSLSPSKERLVKLWGSKYKLYFCISFCTYMGNSKQGAHSIF